MPTSQHTIVTIQNIDNEDFIFEYNRSEGNAPFLIRAGEIARFPKFLAQHALKHLITKILNKRKEKTNNQTLRMELANQIIVGEEKAAQVPQLTEAERLRKEVENLNEPSALDKILAKRKEEKTHKKAVKKVERGEVAEEKFEGLEKAAKEPTKEPKKAEETKEAPEKTEKPKEEPKKAIPKPTRAELFEFAKKEMNMVIEGKTKKRLDKMTVDGLIKELQYPMEN